MSAEMVVVVFPSRGVLTRALDRIAKLDYIDIKRAAVVAKATSGETVILDDDLTPNQGGIAGGTLGAAMTMLGVAQLGALALPGVGVIIALGTAAFVGAFLGRATGRFAANYIDFGFRSEQIADLSAQLQAGRPALVLELKNRDEVLPRLRDELSSTRCEFIEPAQSAMVSR